MLANADINVVMISTPNPSHLEMVEKAAAAGKHIICEKPAAMTVAQFDRMVEVTEKAGVIFTVHQQRRWDRDYRVMKEVYDREMVGKPYVIKSQLYGFNGNMGPLGIGTRYQRQQMNDITVEKAFNMFMEYTHYNVDARLIKRYFAQSAETIEWLEEKGVEFEGAFRYFPKSEPTWHIVKTDKGIGPRAASFMNKALYARALELGVQFLLETPGKQILKENGKVCGVIATDKNGEEVHISCKAAILATGGAGCNKKLIKEETGYDHGKNLFSFAIPGLMGDGMRMAWEAGADKTTIRIELIAEVENGGAVTGSVANVFTQPNLLVNLAGKRIMNEEHMQNTTFLGNVVTHQKNKTCFPAAENTEFALAQLGNDAGIYGGVQMILG